MAKKVIDISEYNGAVNFKKAKAAGVDGVIIKIINRKLQKDPRFMDHYKGCKEAGLPWGVYNYSYATTKEKAKSDMNLVCDILDGLDKTNFKYGIWFDIEDRVQAALSKDKIAGILNAAKKTVEGRGYAFGIYTGMSYLDEHIDQSAVDCKRYWIARYSSKSVVNISKNPAAAKKPKNCKGSMVGWQYTEKGYIGSGVGTGNANHFDVSLWYGDKAAEAASPKKASTGKAVSTGGKTAEDLLKQARAWIGKKESDGSFRCIVDVYNSHKPLARGYKMTYTNSWCATFVSACAIKAGMTDLIPTECSCQRMIDLMKQKGIWVENENRTPAPGDIIFYDWQDSGVGDCNGWADHVGIVEKVDGGKITVIEGNYSDSVKRRTTSKNARYIRGYGVPKYTKTKSSEKEKDAAAATTKKTYTGSFPNLPKRGFFKQGDEGDQVKRLQKFLVWSVKADLQGIGIYGPKTTI